MSNNIIRGGQINLHNLRMAKQVLLICCSLSFLAASTFSLYWNFKDLPSYKLHQYVHLEYLTFKRDVGVLKDNRPQVVSWREQDGYKKVRSDRLLFSRYAHNLKTDLKLRVEKSLEYFCYSFFVALTLLIMFWYWRGKHSFRAKKLRGRSIKDANATGRLLRLKKKASDLKVGPLPLYKDAETMHTLVIGTTGSGKTNLINTLLPQISKRPNRAFVVDTTGDLISKFYSPERGDIIVNPFDSRSHTWLLFEECVYDYQYDALASSIIPQKGSYTDPIWRNGAVSLLSAALMKAKQTKMTPSTLYDILMRSSLKGFYSFFKDTKAAGYADPLGEKMTLSFRASLVEAIGFLDYLDPKEKTLKIKDWVHDDDDERWIFITANEDQHETLRPLITSITDLLTNTLMTLPESRTRRLWLVLDELPALNKLGSLSALLSKGRKYGACVLAGLQSMSQFEEIYGHNESKTLLNLFNTKFFFRMEETKACEEVSRWLGEEEISEAKEGLSYGSHQIRDGVSLNHQTQTRRLVLPTEIADLENLTCYFKFPDGVPAGKFKLPFKKLETQHPSFVLRETNEQLN